MDLILFAKMKKYVDDTVAGSGSLQGKSAYDIAVEGGFEGSEAEWLKSLQGTSPHIGENGNWYIGEEDTGISANILPDWNQNDGTAGNYIKNRPFYEKDPAYNIQWDGAIGDRFNIDLSILGISGWYLVKISDIVLTSEELIGGSLEQANGYKSEIKDNKLDFDTYPGAISIDGGTIAIVYDSDTLNVSLGTPSDYITNGTYFAYSPPEEHVNYTTNLVGPTEIVKIDKKFLPEIEADLSSLHSVARTGNYNELSNKPTIYTDVIRYNTSQSLSSTNKSRARTNIDVYSKSEVDNKIANNLGGISEGQVQSMIDDSMSEVQSMIAEAIGSAIGSGY